MAIIMASNLRNTIVSIDRLMETIYGMNLEIGSRKLFAGVRDILALEMAESIHRSRISQLMLPSFLGHPWDWLEDGL